MDADGELTRVPGGGGCCWFVSSPWLSPDGTAAIEVIAGDRLRLNDLEGVDPPRVIELDPPVGDLDTGVVPVTAWSPDSARIAYTAYEQVGTDLLPSVFVVDLDTGSARQLVGQGLRPHPLRAEPEGERVRQPVIGSLSHPGDIPIRSDEHRGRRCHFAEEGQKPRAGELGVDQLHSLGPGCDLEAGSARRG